ncbi:protein of unknown function [Aminobacter niigataensis]|nr:protein of unknown function [Aminobacter niigataensis]
MQLLDNRNRLNGPENPRFQVFGLMHFASSGQFLAESRIGHTCAAVHGRLCICIQSANT